MNTVKIRKDNKAAEVSRKWLAVFEKDGWEPVEGPTEEEASEKVSVSTDDLIELINSSNDKDDIEAIVLDAKGIDIDKRGGISAVKKKAIAALTGESDEG